MSEGLVAVLLVLASYLVGTFPTAALVGRRKGFDPTTTGSGNPGATNVYRVGGKKAGAVVLAVDLAKGAVPAAVGLLVGGRPLGFACWAAAMLGHIFPVFRRFRGGKGVATGAGGVIVLLPLVALCCAAAFFITVAITRRASVASLVMTLLAPVLMIVFGHPAWEVLVGGALALLVIARHWSNIKRLFQGREPAVVGSGDPT